MASEHGQGGDPSSPATQTPHRSTLQQFVRYLFVGGGAFLVDFGTMALLHHGVGLHYLTAAGCGFLLGLLVNYTISIVWVFTQRRQDPKLEFVVFATVGLVGLGLNQGIIWLLTEHVLAIPLLSKVVAAGTVLCWNFSARKILLF